MLLGGHIEILNDLRRGIVTSRSARRIGLLSACELDPDVDQDSERLEREPGCTGELA